MRFISYAEAPRYGRRINMRVARFGWLEYLPHSLAFLIFLAPMGLSFELVRGWLARVWPESVEWICSRCGCYLHPEASHCPTCAEPLREALLQSESRRGRQR